MEDHVNPELRKRLAARKAAAAPAEPRMQYRQAQPSNDRTFWVTFYVICLIVFGIIGYLVE